MTTPTRDNELEALVAEHIYHRDAEIIDIGYGFTLHFVARYAVPGFVAYVNFTGGAFEKARMQNGDVVEIYCRYCPAWSVSIEAAWELMEYINRTGSDLSWLAFRDALRRRGLSLGLPQGVAARNICEAALEAEGVKR